METLMSEQDPTDTKPSVVDMDELSLFILPAYGFRSRTAAKAYVDTAYADSHFWMPHKVRAQEGDDRFFAAIPGWWDSRLGAQMLAEDYSHRRRRDGPTQIWEMLKKKDKDKPDGGYTVALLVDGRRQWYRHHVRDRAHDPGWWKRIDTGRRDCYAAWSRFDGSPLRPILRKSNGKPSTDPDFKSKHIYAARSGRGAIYASTTVYNRDGSIAGNEVRLLLVEFSILDRNAQKDDMLRVTIVRQTRFFPDPTAHIPKPDLGEMDQGWYDLVEEAHAGFVRECAPAIQENEDYRRMILDTRTAKQADEAKPWGERFAQVIEGMSWEEAFALCDAPWKLAAAIGKFHLESRFWDAPGNYAGSTGSRWPKMLDALGELPEERSAQIGVWLRDYVVPMNNMWNYCGD